MTVRLPTGATPACALSKPAGRHLSLHCSICILPHCLAATPLGILPPRLAAAAGPLSRAPTTALVEGSLLPSGPLLLQLDWQAPASPALVSRGFVGGLQLGRGLHGAGEAQLWGAAALLAALAGATPAVRLCILLCFHVRPARATTTRISPECPSTQLTGPEWCGDR